MKTSWVYHDPAFESDGLNPILKHIPWSGHRRFGYDLVANLRPSSIAELGTHYGCSLFCFAQAAKDHSIACRLVAVDTWEGDPHAGRYGPEVLAMVRRTVGECFGGLDIELRQALFSEALGSYEDASFDMIHIDGYHSYEAASEDFRSWLPKLRPGGLILMHDVGGHTGYGSAEFWVELKQSYPGRTFEFPFSWGLGIVAPKGDAMFARLADIGIESLLHAYHGYHYASADAQKVELIDRHFGLLGLRDQLDSARQEISRLLMTITAKDAELLALQRGTETHGQSIGSYERTIANKDEYIAHLHSVLKERDLALTDLSDRVRARDSDITAWQETVAGKDAYIAQANSRLDELQGLVPSLLSEIESCKSTIAEKDHRIAKLIQQVQALDSEARETRDRLQRIRDTRTFRLLNTLGLGPGRDEAI